MDGLSGFGFKIFFADFPICGGVDDFSCCNGIHSNHGIRNRNFGGGLRFLFFVLPRTVTRLPVVSLNVIEGVSFIRKGTNFIHSIGNPIREGDDRIREIEDRIREGEDRIREGEDRIREGEDRIW